jgi:hypothetical protein
MKSNEELKAASDEILVAEEAVDLVTKLNLVGIFVSFVHNMWCIKLYSSKEYMTMRCAPVGTVNSLPELRAWYKGFIAARNLRGDLDDNA